MSAVKKRPARQDPRTLKSTVSVFDGKVDDEVSNSSVVHKEYTSVTKKLVESKQSKDPFTEHYGATMGKGSNAIIEPSLNQSILSVLPKENSVLLQLIETMQVNTVGHGHSLEYVHPLKEGEEIPDEHLALKEAIDNFVEYPNGDESGRDLWKKIASDKETFGDAYIEVVRDDKNIEPYLLYHVPSKTMRKTHKDAESTKVEVLLPRGGDFKKVTVSKFLRRYVQRVGKDLVYFKEFGDPRVISSQDGTELTQDHDGGDVATEIINLSRYDSSSAYGIPRWINQLPSIFGTRQAELTNLNFFSDNAIPALAIIVGGGQLTENSFNGLEAAISGAKGRESMNKVVIIEAEGYEDAAAESGAIPAPKISLEPLASSRGTDGNFQQYELDSSAKIRSSFRIAPIFLGGTDDYTRATAQTSFEVVESQVFAPARKDYNDVMNRILLPVDGSKPIWRFKFNQATLASPMDTLEAMQTLDGLGAMTPNLAIDISNNLFDLKIARINHKWGDYPMSLVNSLVQSGQGLGGAEEVSDSLNDVEDDLMEDEVKDGKEEDENSKAKKTLTKTLLTLKQICDFEVKKGKTKDE